MTKAKDKTPPSPKQEKAPAKTPARRAAAIDPRTEDASPAAHAAALSAGSATEATTSRRRAATTEDETVTVIVPRAFRLQTAPGILVAYEPGTQEMPLSHAEHSYAVDNGVTLYKPTRP